MKSRGQTHKGAVVGGCAAFALLAGCSSDGNILPKRERFTSNVRDAGESDVAPDVANVTPDVASDGKPPRDPEANCVKPGTANNERGVGGYCEPNGAYCASDQGQRYCTADLGTVTPVPDNAWFCTTICTNDGDCGSGVICVASPVGNGCIPIVCAGDAGAGATR